MSKPAGPDQDNPDFLAYKIVGIYAVFGGLWILLSDRLLWASVTDPYWNHALQTYKGWFYVAVTAALLYLLIRNSLARMKSLEEERRGAELKLLQAQKMELVGRLAGGVAHDFNNILTAIMGLAQMTAPTLDKNDPRRADMEDIVKFSERAAAITRQLLAFSRKQISQPRQLDLGAHIKCAEKMLRRAAGKIVEIEVQVAGDLWTVMADPCQLDQVLLNLVVNARDAMPRGGKLMISAGNSVIKEPPAPGPADTPPGSYVMLKARDNGCGMDQAVLARIFEPFFTTKQPGKGTGLGLAVVQGIVEQAGGRIAVESRPGDGTVFRIYLPKYSGPAQARAQAAAQEQACGGKETILLVDDQPEIMQVMRRVLELQGYTVLCAGSYKEALAQAVAARSPVEILVTDVLLAGSNGPELADELAGLYPGIKVLFISGEAADPAVQDRILSLDRPFLPKPFTPEAFLVKVRQTLDSPAA